MTGQSGFAAVLQLGTTAGSATTYATVGKITGDITIPAPDVTDIDVTNHSSAGGFKESIRGLQSGGTIAVKILLEDDDTMRATVAAAIGNVASVLDWRILWPSGAIASTFKGWAVAGGQTFPLDAAAEYSLSIHITGVVTEAPVSA